MKMGNSKIYTVKLTSIESKTKVTTETGQSFT